MVTQHHLQANVDMACLHECVLECLVIGLSITAELPKLGTCEFGVTEQVPWPKINLLPAAAAAAVFQPYMHLATNHGTGTCSTSGGLQSWRLPIAKSQTSNTTYLQTINPTYSG
jgi:hypothetical protein